MKLLLDTHTFLWYITGDERLPERDLSLINDKKNECRVSIASLWEIVIKMSINKLEIKGGFQTVENFLDNNDFELLPVNFKHTKKLLTLPMYHKDPFDRMIIVQGITNKLTIISKDKSFSDYKPKLLW